MQEVTGMAKYSQSDCLAAIQLVGWMVACTPSDVTVTLYQAMGMSPSSATIINRFGGWEKAKSEAESTPQLIPTHLPQYYQSVAALRRAQDLGVDPVTGAGYRARADEIGVSYLDALSPFRTWTMAKRVAFSDS